MLRRQEKSSERLKSDVRPRQGAMYGPFPRAAKSELPVDETDRDPHMSVAFGSDKTAFTV